jgi:ATP-binding cassette subfamily A (ABC1) protein 3
MEEADALATRAAIISQRILAVGSTKFLREKYGNMYHVHLVLDSAPSSTEEEMKIVEEWVGQTFVGVQLDSYGSLHGQIKFSVPVAVSEEKSNADEAVIDCITAVKNDAIQPKKSVIRALFCQLEASKKTMGLRSYSVGATTLDQVFLNVVSANNVLEEGYAAALPSKTRKWF